MFLYLVRHGESVGNLMQTLHGQTDYPLTEKGLMQARAAAEKLRGISFTRCVSSDLIRARDTALVCLEGRNIALETTPDLREQGVGYFEDITMAEAEAQYPKELAAFLTDWHHNIAPGGEKSPAFMARVRRAVEDIVSRGEDTLMVGHNGSLTMTLYCLGLVDKSVLTKTVASFRQGTVTTIEIKEGRARLIDMNR